MQLTIQHTIRRYRTLKTGRISALPIVILMPHSSCNCRCVMCDIWKGNARKNQLSLADVEQLIISLRKLGTRMVVMSGGEALLNENFFSFCELLKKENIRVSLLSTGLLLKKHAENIVKHVNDIIVSLDGDEQTHNAIRNIEGAYARLKDGVQRVKKLKPSLRITGRSVIQKMNFRNWPLIIDSARSIGLDAISFLPADITSDAFNRDQPWDSEHVSNVVIQEDELPELQAVLDFILKNYQHEFDTRFISESPEKLLDIYTYYKAINGFCKYPAKKCNAPWVSAVVEADGTVRPCFFHEAIGNIRDQTLENILNDNEAINFRRKMDMTLDPCKKCVCSLNLPFYQNPA